MMIVTHTIDPSRTPLMVGEIHEDGSVTAVTPKGEMLHVSRFDIETPVVACEKCGKAVLLKKEKHTDKEYAECPDHARHMYDSYFAASHDVKNFSHDKRREMCRKAVYWLNKWRRTFESRTGNKVDTSCA